MLVEIHLKVCAVFFLLESGKLAALLKGDPDHTPTYHVSIGIKRKTVVGEIVNGKGFPSSPVLTSLRTLLTKPDTPWVNILKADCSK